MQTKGNGSKCSKILHIINFKVFDNNFVFFSKT